MSAVDAEAELSVFDEVVAERDAARADAYEKVQALAAVSGILLGNDVPSTWDHYGAVADARECARERDEAVLLASANFEALRAQASAATQEVARLTKLTEHMATELNVAWDSSRKHEAQRDEAREQLAKAYDVIAWMKALPGVSHLMAVSLLRGGR